jgi:CheY-like chemotaxis protein
MQSVTKQNRRVREEAQSTATRPRVLIVDEDETARDLYGRWFFTHGFEVMCAVGTSGLSLALRRGRPQLIITELRARDLTFAALSARLRAEQNTRCIPVIVLTTSADQAAMDAAKAVGAVAVLPKWCDFDLLDSWVSSVCS